MVVKVLQALGAACRLGYQQAGAWERWAACGADSMGAPARPMRLAPLDRLVRFTRQPGRHS